MGFCNIAFVSPILHQLNLVNDHLLLARLSRKEIDDASFLDQRIMKQTTQGAWVPWQQVAENAGSKTATATLGMIFHVGHCGSTLLSRLMAFAHETQSLREPLPLRVLAQDLADSYEGRSFLDRQSLQKRLGVLLSLWGRGASHTLIKATSVCTDLLPEISAVDPQARSLFVYNDAETHIATLLAGQNAMVDLRGFGQLRIQRLRQSSGLDIKLSHLNLGQLAVVSWLSETYSMADSIQRLPGQIEALEFETLLQQPASTLEHLFQHMKIPVNRDQIEKAVNSPVLQTYSKAPEHQYNAQTRAAILSESRARFQNEIRDSMGWLESLARQSDLVQEALQKFA